MFFQNFSGIFQNYWRRFHGRATSHSKVFEEGFSARLVSALRTGLASSEDSLSCIDKNKRLPVKDLWRGEILDQRDQKTTLKSRLELGLTRWQWGVRLVTNGTAARFHIHSSPVHYVVTWEGEKETLTYRQTSKLERGFLGLESSPGYYFSYCCLVQTLLNTTHYERNGAVLWVDSHLCVQV